MGHASVMSTLLLCDYRTHNVVQVSRAVFRCYPASGHLTLDNFCLECIPYALGIRIGIGSVLWFHWVFQHHLIADGPATFGPGYLGSLSR